VFKKKREKGEELDNMKMKGLDMRESERIRT